MTFTKAQPALPIASPLLPCTELEKGGRRQAAGLRAEGVAR